MKLQIAFDGELEQSLTILRGIHDLIDIAEIGTPLIIREGLRAVRRFRSEFPDLTLLADLKIMDAGYLEASLAFEAGCDYVTVLGLAQDRTVRGALEAAASFGGRVMVDLIQTQNAVARSFDLLNMGCHVLCVHTPFDLQADRLNPLDDLAQLRSALPGASLAVAGGLKQGALQALIPYRPDIVISGGAIVSASDPVEAARSFRRKLDENR